MRVSATLKASSAGWARQKPRSSRDCTLRPASTMSARARQNVDMLNVLVDWVEKGRAPDHLEVVEQKIEPPAFPVVRALPLCRWPAWPHYKSGPVTEATSF